MADFTTATVEGIKGESNKEGESSCINGESNKEGKPSYINGGSIAQRSIVRESKWEGNDDREQHKLHSKFKFIRLIFKF